jgi:hypothetical protein
MSQGNLAARLFAVVPLLFAACVEAPDQGDEPELGTEAQELGGCSLWGCQSNSPLIDGLEFHELEENGLPNLEGFRLAGLYQPASGRWYDVNVAGARIIAESRDPSVYPSIAGTNLINSYMVVLAPTGVYYRIIIKNVSNVTKFWVGNQNLIETYELVYTKHFTPADPRPMCKYAPGRLDPEGNFWLKPLEAIVFTGDRYETSTMDVTAASYAAAGDWFNIGCAGSALAKLHLNRHTTAGSDSTHQTSLNRRQAMLKMYVADVCGNGFSSTRQGTPLVWENFTHWQNLPAAVSGYEGFWGSNGMLCMEHHRLENDPDWAVAGGIRDQIISSCGSLPPTCSSLYPGFPNVAYPFNAYLKTAIP